MLRMDEEVWLEGLMIRLEDKIKWDEKNVWTHRKFIGQVRRENNGKRLNVKLWTLPKVGSEELQVRINKKKERKLSGKKKRKKDNNRKLRNRRRGKEKNIRLRQHVK